MYSFGADTERGIWATCQACSFCVQIQDKCQTAVLLNAKGEPRSGGGGEAAKKNEPKPVSRPAKPAVSYLFFPNALPPHLPFCSVRMEFAFTEALTPLASTLVIGL